MRMQFPWCRPSDGDKISEDILQGDCRILTENTKLAMKNHAINLAGRRESRAKGRENGKRIESETRANRV
jgi:hypothetical protein